MNLAWILLALATPPTVPAVQEPNPLMMALAHEFDDAAKALGARDAAAMAEHVGRLRETCQGLCDVRPQRNDDMKTEFAARASSVSELASAVSGLAAKKDLILASSAFEDLRSACVECHVKFRSRNEERGMFPARGNTIAGTATVVAMNGKEREDRSNVLVFLEKVPTEPGARVPWRPLRIVQRDARFDPSVLPILKGQTVEFPNDDFIFHNVFSLSDTQPFDLGAYGPGQSKSVVFPRTGLVRVYCNIHPEMLSTIVVLENPFFALTDARGLFSFTGVPDGTYVLRTWHEYGGDLHESVALSGSTLHAEALRILEDRVRVEHRNKFGLPYREAYK